MRALWIICPDPRSIDETVEYMPLQQCFHLLLELHAELILVNLVLSMDEKSGEKVDVLDVQPTTTACEQIAATVINRQLGLDETMLARSLPPINISVEVSLCVETVVVAAASGPVGSLVGQLAKMAGARAVGVAGGPEKCHYVIDELRFDAAVDHRAPDFAQKLAAACPKGIDVYFENVGGADWQAVLPLLNTFARVPFCGLIARYSATGQAAGPNLLPATMREVLSKSLTPRGFINYEFAAEHYATFLRTVSAAIADGRIRYREDITDGLENAPAAFIGMLEGCNFGKALVRVAR